MVRDAERGTHEEREGFDVELGFVQLGADILYAGFGECNFAPNCAVVISDHRVDLVSFQERRILGYDLFGSNGGATPRTTSATKNEPEPMPSRWPRTAHEMLAGAPHKRGKIVLEEQLLKAASLVH